MLGKGAYGAVHEALLESGASVAVKRVDLGRCAPGKEAGLALSVESDVLRNLPPHPHVVSFLASDMPSDGRGEALIWMECVSGGSVSGMLRTYGAMREDTAASFTAHALSGLAFLHAHGVMHRDVKPANLLVTVCGTVKLGDFGSACVLDREGGRARGIAGTPNYMAPEMLRIVNPAEGPLGCGDGSYDCKVDVWSLGMTLVEMLTADAPYSELSNPFAVMFHIARHPSPPLPPSASSRALAFLGRCLERCPEARAGSLELLTDPYLPPHFGRLAVEAARVSPAEAAAAADISCKTMARKLSLPSAWKCSQLPPSRVAPEHPIQERRVQFGRTSSSP
jgi:serine/threonine protein kinase